MYYLASVYHIITFVVFSLVYFPLAFITWGLTICFDRRLAVLHLLSSVWASSFTWTSPIWNVSVTGRQHVDRKKAYVMVCNHQSMLDIPVIYRIFLHFKWVSKASLFKIPIIGWNLWMNRHIKLERSSIKSQRKMLRICAENIQRGSSVMIFPEGTRSRDGKLRAFKEGAFLIALQQKTDILPIVLDGSSGALPERGFFPNRKRNICLHILPPIPYVTFKDMGIRKLTEHVHTIIADELAEMRAQQSQKA